MWETIILLTIYLVVSLTCLVVACWVVITGQFLDIDGLLLMLVCLSLAVVFLTAFALAVRRGEFAGVLKRLRRPKPVAPPKSAGQGEPAKTSQR